MCSYSITDQVFQYHIYWIMVFFFKDFAIVSVKMCCMLAAPAQASSNMGVGQQGHLSENKKKKQKDTYDAVADFLRTKIVLNDQ